MTKRKMTDKQRKAFHADQDMKVRCWSCGRRVVPYETVDFDDYGQPRMIYACTACGEEIEPFGKWDKDEQP